MKIQSISIVVPTKGCINNCRFCVSKMYDTATNNKFNEIQIEKRLRYAANNGVNTVVITGTGKPLQNKRFLERLADIFDNLNHPFPNIELQTTGILLFDHFRFEGEETDLYENLQILERLRVNTISLSISNLFDSDNNWDIIRAPKKKRIDLNELCSKIKDYNFNLRLSLNLTHIYNSYSVKQIFDVAKSLDADQITFRKLYHAKDESAESKWVIGCSIGSYFLKNIKDSVKQVGTKLYTLPFGAEVYSIEGMSVVIDEDCMSKNDNDNLRYAILKENGKLYCRWDDEGSLLF